MHHLVEVSVVSDIDIVAAEMWALGAVGIEERDHSLKAAFTDHTQALLVAGRFQAEVQTVADTEGLDEWRGHATAHRAGPFRIRPPWIEPGEGLDLVVDSGRAFGSGSHPSTRLALELLAAKVEPGAHLLDAGSGSAILSIGAALLGATAVAVDIDPAAESATATNAGTNDVSERVEFRLGSVDLGAGSYDLAVANVTIDVHEAIAPAFNRLVTAPHLIVSGILAGPQEQRCADAYERIIGSRVSEGEWVALVLEP